MSVSQREGGRAWTPGPWKYGQESVDPEWWIVTIRGGLIVANVNAHFCQEANARLIAAAPELFEALAEVEKLLIGIEATDYPVSRELAIVRAALSLAAGETDHG